MYRSAFVKRVLEIFMGGVWKFKGFLWEFEGLQETCEKKIF